MFHRGVYPVSLPMYTIGMDLFDDRAARAMLIGREEAAFDDPEYLYELKLDGDRCLAYLGEGKTDLINRRGRRLLPYLPELAGIHAQARERCILDGELIIGSGLKDEFEHIRSRMTTTNKYAVERKSRENPATFVCYDILYLKDRDLLDLPLSERKELMGANLVESPRLAPARFVAGQGVAFYDLVVAQGLEGVVAKRRDSLYQMGKRSHDWVKFKNWTDDDFVICGYFPSDRANVVSLVLGQYANGELVYKSHVVLGRNNPAFARVEALPGREAPTVYWGPKPEKHHKTIWLEPRLVCRVEYMCLTPGGGLRQPIFKGLRDDKLPRDCIAPDLSTNPKRC